MRAIKFRGFSLDNGKWVYGYLHLPTDGDDMMIQVSSNTDSFNVLPDTVGQFTGLHDKLGKEIYEGDVIDFISPFFRDHPYLFEAPLDPKHSYQCVVVWDVRDCGFGLVSLKEALLKPLEQQPVGITQISDSYLIGNIHDNPELLTLNK